MYLPCETQSLAVFLVRPWVYWDKATRLDALGPVNRYYFRLNMGRDPVSDDELFSYYYRNNPLLGRSTSDYDPSLYTCDPDDNPQMKMQMGDS